MYEQVCTKLYTCEECQLRSLKRKVDMLTNTYSFALQEIVAVDVVYMLLYIGKKFLVIARDYLSSQLETRALTNNKLNTIAQFIYKDIIYRQSITRKLIVDSGLDFAKVIKALSSIYYIKRV